MSEYRATVMVVDDEESMRHFLAKTLRREGYEVVSAADGPDALAAAQVQAVDLALVDIRMPGMDGVALMRTLRASHPRLPVILMTAYGSVQNALHAMKYGAADYVTKPFRVDAIRAKVAKYLTEAPRAQAPPTIRSLDQDATPPDEVPLPEPPSGSAEAPPRGIVAFLRERCAERSLPAPSSAAGRAGLRELIRLSEMVYVDELLETTGGNVSRAAEIAGITRPNLHRKAVDLGLDADAYRKRRHR
jgi:DNA-binding NtrC family response regulator